MKNCSDCIKNNRKPNAIGCLSCKTAKAQRPVVSYNVEIETNLKDCDKANVFIANEDIVEISDSSTFKIINIYED